MRILERKWQAFSHKIECAKGKNIFPMYLGKTEGSPSTRGECKGWEWRASARGSFGRLQRSLPPRRPPTPLQGHWQEEPHLQNQQSLNGRFGHACFCIHFIFIWLLTEWKTECREGGSCYLKKKGLLLGCECKTKVKGVIFCAHQSNRSFYIPRLSDTRLHKYDSQQSIPVLRWLFHTKWQLTMWFSPYLICCFFS